MLDYENALRILEKYGQEHIMKYYEELNENEKQ